MCGESYGTGHFYGHPRVSADITRQALTRLQCPTDTLDTIIHIDLIMDKAYEDDYTRYIAQTLGFNPIVPPKSNRTNPWGYDKELYKRRNEIERLFRILDGFRRIFVRFEKLDVMYMGFVKFALVYVAIK